MPGWYEVIQDDLDAGTINAVGVVQEQHGDRARLFNQWKQLRMDLFVDSLNQLNCSAVPFVYLVDSQRIVRFKNPSREQYRTFITSTQNQPGLDSSQPPHDEAKDEGNHLVLAGRLDEAINHYQAQTEQDASDARAHFRLGVTFRKRFDSGRGTELDFQRAVRHWQRALSLDPNQYIWRRRIQQYGPVLDKPYPFYNWVETARTEILARGEQPIPLTVEPRGAELASPQPGVVESASAANPDPDGKLLRDRQPVIRVTPIVVASTTGTSRAVRVHLVLSPDPTAQTSWNNESGPAQVWFQPHDALSFEASLHELPGPAEAISVERRTIDLEVRWDAELAEPPPLQGFAIYSVCDKVTGVCRLLRQDFTVKLSPRSE